MVETFMPKSESNLAWIVLFPSFFKMICPRITNSFNRQFISLSLKPLEFFLAHTYIQHDVD
jgi:hypothetical protein